MNRGWEEIGDSSFKTMWPNRSRQDWKLHEGSNWRTTEGIVSAEPFHNKHPSSNVKLLLSLKAYCNNTILYCNMYCVLMPTERGNGTNQKYSLWTIWASPCKNPWSSKVLTTSELMSSAMPRMGSKWAPCPRVIKAKGGANAYHNATIAANSPH